MSFEDSILGAESAQSFTGHVTLGKLHPMLGHSRKSQGFALFLSCQLTHRPSETFYNVSMMLQAPLEPCYSL